MAQVDFVGRLCREVYYFMRTEIQTAGGQTLQLPLNDTGAQQHFNYAGSYTDELLRQINDEKIYKGIFEPGRKDHVFLDIGANIGLVSIHAHDVCRYVVDIEPSTHFPMLVYMVRHYPNILPIPVALHSSNDPVNLWFCDSNTTSHSTAVAVGGRTTTVTGQTLAMILAAYFPADMIVDVAKIDVEGGEFASLTTEQIMGAKNKVKLYYVETHPSAGMNHITVRDILTGRFESAGYEVERWPSGTLIARQR